MAAGLAALDRSLSGLEDSLRKARTPRVRRKKLAQAARHADAAAAVVATLPMATAPLDLSEVREALAIILAGQAAYPDWRVALLGMARDARLEVDVMRRADDDALAMLFMLAA